MKHLDVLYLDDSEGIIEIHKRLLPYYFEMIDIEADFIWCKLYKDFIEQEYKNFDLFMIDWVLDNKKTGRDILKTLPEKSNVIIVTGYSPRVYESIFEYEDKLNIQVLQKPLQKNSFLEIVKDMEI